MTRRPAIAQSGPPGFGEHVEPFRDLPLEFAIA
jgi:hypothetical protein